MLLLTSTKVCWEINTEENSMSMPIYRHQIQDKIIKFGQRQILINVVSSCVLSQESRKQISIVFMMKLHGD
jgi:hypothetical protein